jgi:hypothetical protein
VTEFKLNVRPPHAPSRPPAGPFARLLGLVLLVVPLAGAAFHVVFYLAAPAEWRAAYAQSAAIWIVILAAFANLAGSVFLYLRTRTGLSVWARVASYLWILSLALYIRLLIYG